MVQVKRVCSFSIILKPLHDHLLLLFLESSVCRLGCRNDVASDVLALVRERGIEKDEQCEEGQGFRTHHRQHTIILHLTSSLQDHPRDVYFAS